MQLSLFTVDIHGSNFAMHFSTMSPPRPSLLMLVTNGPARLEHPEITSADMVASSSAVIFFILPPMAWVCLGFCFYGWGLTLASTAGGYWRLFCSSTAKKVTVAGGQIAGACYTLFLFVVISKTRLKIEVDLIF